MMRLVNDLLILARAEAGARLVAVSAGLLGGLLSRLMLASFTGLPDRFCAYRRKRPVAFAAFCGFAVAVIAVVTDGEAVGVGHQHTQALLNTPGEAHHTPVLFTGLKLIASWLSSWAGVPGGVGLNRANARCASLRVYSGNALACLL